MDQCTSPYEAVLGGELSMVHPRLRTYFSAVPYGSVGVGDGVFSTVGAPRRWLHPLIWLFAGRDVAFPVWEHDVPFTVVNSPALFHNAPAVAAERTFHLPGGDRVMRDLIVATGSGLVDVLGRRRRFRVWLDTEVSTGALRMQSRRVELRVGSLHIPIPALVAPRVRLAEEFSDADNRQHVAVSITLPFLGKVYGYEGSFRYEIRLGDR